MVAAGALIPSLPYDHASAKHAARPCCKNRALTVDDDPLAIRFSSSGERAGTKPAKRRQFVTFPGPGDAESRRIVDLVAIRRDHRAGAGVFERGDLFEIVFVQDQGGGSARDASTLGAQRDVAAHVRHVVI